MKQSKKIERIIEDKNTDTIISFESEGITGHEDHKIVHKWAKCLAEKLGVKLCCTIENSNFYERHGKELHEKYNIYFNIEKPNLVHAEDADICLDFDKNSIYTKPEAIKAHASQTSTLFSDAKGEKIVKIMAARECFVVDSR
jgi:LmbE family N-acetylglucosaminyl deacetylase